MSGDGKGVDLLQVPVTPEVVLTKVRESDRECHVCPSKGKIPEGARSTDVQDVMLDIIQSAKGQASATWTWMSRRGAVNVVPLT